MRKSLVLCALVGGLASSVGCVVAPEPNASAYDEAALDENAAAVAAKNDAAIPLIEKKLAASRPLVDGRPSLTGTVAARFASYRTASHALCTNTLHGAPGAKACTVRRERDLAALLGAYVALADAPHPIDDTAARVAHPGCYAAYDKATADANADQKKDAFVALDQLVWCLQTDLVPLARGVPMPEAVRPAVDAMIAICDLPLQAGFHVGGPAAHLDAMGCVADGEAQIFEALAALSK
jgi:hypothetical protein